MATGFEKEDFGSVSHGRDCGCDPCGSGAINNNICGEWSVLTVDRKRRKTGDDQDKKEEGPPPAG
jgi:hypothetical protein